MASVMALHVIVFIFAVGAGASVVTKPDNCVDGTGNICQNIAHETVDSADTAALLQSHANVQVVQDHTKNLLHSDFFAQDATASNDSDPSCSAPSPSPVFKRQATPTKKNSPWDLIEQATHTPYEIVHKQSRCPPWFDTSENGPQIFRTYKAHGIWCKRDTVELAIMFIRPNNRCGPNGECKGLKYPGNDGVGFKSACVIYNDETFYPESSSAGFCIPAGKVTFGLPYIEHQIKAIWEDEGWDWTMATRWAQRDSPEVLTCKNFCTGGPSGEYGFAAEHVRWSGEHGFCKCHCMSAGPISASADALYSVPFSQSARRFDRCSSVSQKVCTDATYCGGHGKATWKKKQDCKWKGPFRKLVCQEGKCSDEGVCSCECKDGWSGKNCDLAPNTACDLNDCNHFGQASGKRPNCKCKCGHMEDDKCTKHSWHKGNSIRYFTSKSNAFENNGEACMDSNPHCWEYGNWCWYGKFVDGVRADCKFTCFNKACCKFMGKFNTDWWVFATQDDIDKGSPSRQPPRNSTPPTGYIPLSTCTDTPGWNNGHAKHKIGCARYQKHWCVDGQAKPGKEFAFGSRWKFPERNCCACGKALPTTKWDVLRGPVYKTKAGGQCPSGHIIATLRLCEEAHRQLGMSWGKIWEEGGKGIPLGCSTKASENTLHFSFGETGKGRDDLEAICQATAGTPAPPGSTCTDTPGWNNGHSMLTCKFYAKKWCADGKARRGKEFALGHRWKFPENNCCACGK